MSIDKPIVETTLRLKEEIASKNTMLMREIQRNPSTGFLEATFPIQIFAESITYELDAAGNKIDIYDRKPGRAINLTEEEIMGIWATAVTLDDGTKTYLGQLISDKLDALIEPKFVL